MAIFEPPEFEQNPFPELLKGQIAFVTGGGSGMGLGMAQGLAQAGASIACVGRSIERAEDGARQIRENGGNAIAISCDVRDEAAIKAAFDEVEAKLGLVTILANNAGANFSVLSEKLSTNAWNAVTRIAIDGTFLCSNEFARRLIAAGKSGAIVNNSAQYIYTGFPSDAHSAAAKSAIAAMTKTQAKQWAKFGIRVNCIAAGFFPHASSLSSNSGEGQAERINEMMPMGRTGRIREFGWVSTFVCTPLCNGLSGQVLMIDGAESLRKSLMSPPWVAPRDRANPWDYV